MCSKCFKDCQAEKAGVSVGMAGVGPASAAAPEPESECTPCAPCAPVQGGAAAAAAGPSATPPPAKKKGKNRCLICRKKVGLTGFSCRCVVLRSCGLCVLLGCGCGRLCALAPVAPSCPHASDVPLVACRCGGLFCGAHRMSDAHSCTFDYKAHSSEQLQQSGRVDKVVPDKITKI
eukprot:COSAG01_NODE_14213_length_1482_cov_2.300072_2_plen_176_part_00